MAVVLESHPDRNIGRVFHVIAILVGLSLALLSAQQQRDTGTSNHVVIISLDGFGGWAMDDPQLPLPTLRRLAARGATAKGMRPVNPTVTWPNHTSLVTGVTPSRHGVLFNGVLIRQPGVPPRIEPWRDKKEMVRVRTLYDAAHDANLTTAQVDWVAIQNASTITWEFAERPDAKGQIGRELVAAGKISEEDLAAFASRNIIYRDHIWTEAAAHILARHRPNLLMFHLLNLDSTQHRYGPRTPAAMTATALLDSQVARIVETLESSGLLPRTTLFVVADHGFKPVRRQIRANAAFMKAGLLTAKDGKVTRADAYSVPEGGTAMVYVTVDDPTGTILTRAKEALRGVEGIEKIIEPQGYAALGLPLPSENAQMGVLFLQAQPGYAFTGDVGDPIVIDAPAGALGAHGYVAADPDLRALFIAFGRGIKPGVALETVDNIDLAPTAARLLGVELKEVQGRVLTEILSLAN
jgi:predicted AlkP superfamily pyrophosphatase or phosphodiesterase